VVDPDLAIVTKIDLAAAVEFDRDAMLRNIDAVRPGLEVLEVSSRSGAGFDAWLTLLERRAQSGVNPGERQHSKILAGSTGLEPAASGVTGRRSNQLNYDP
jgi:2-keto-4-pentenoate hydratase